MSLIRKVARKTFKRTGLPPEHFEAWFLINYEKVHPKDLEAVLAARRKAKKR